MSLNNHRQDTVGPVNDILFDVVRPENKNDRLIVPNADLNNSQLVKMDPDHRCSLYREGYLIIKWRCGNAIKKYPKSKT